MKKIKRDKEVCSFLFLSLLVFLREVFKVSVIYLRDTSAQDTAGWIPDLRRSCRVIIENKVDFHHEILESAVLRFPLPFHKFNCSSSKPVIYDFALYQNRFHLKIPGLFGSGAKDAKFLNETEFWGWKTYFEKNLQ